MTAGRNRVQVFARSWHSRHLEMLCRAHRARRRCGPPTVRAADHRYRAAPQTPFFERRWPRRGGCSCRQRFIPAASAKRHCLVDRGVVTRRRLLSSCPEAPVPLPLVAVTLSARHHEGLSWSSSWRGHRERCALPVFGSPKRRGGEPVEGTFFMPSSRRALPLRARHFWRRVAHSCPDNAPFTFSRSTHVTGMSPPSGIAAWS